MQQKELKRRINYSFDVENIIYELHENNTPEKKNNKEDRANILFVSLKKAGFILNKFNKCLRAALEKKLLEV